LKRNVRDVVLARVEMLVVSGQVARSVLSEDLVGRLRLPKVPIMVLKWSELIRTGILLLAPRELEVSEVARKAVVVIVDRGHVERDAGVQMALEEKFAAVSDVIRGLHALIVVVIDLVVASTGAREPRAQDVRGSTIVVNAVSVLLDMHTDLRPRV
jgi:hypothetical protein